VVVANVLADGRLRLEDERIVRLAGIRIPAAGPWAEAARKTLRSLLEAHTVRLGIGALAHDRWGALVAQVEQADGVWAQGALLDRGLAQVQTRPGETARATELLARERAARERGAGLWAEPAFQPRAAAADGLEPGRFQIVRGRVQRVAPVERYVYLNFGADWRSDFTVRIGRPELQQHFVRSAIDVEGLAGRRVEVRGVVVEAGGPLIEVTHPEQIEILP
jgi:hypothetical protein